VITEVIVRRYSDKWAGLHEMVSAIIRRETDLTVTDLNHANLALADFDTKGKMVVSLDAFLADQFFVPHLQISRNFNRDGSVAGRRIIAPEFPTNDLCLIDTDICAGKTMWMAMQITGASHFSVPLMVQPHQDLIDIEDLIEPISWLVTGESCSYMLNAEFFSLRTSLPAALYPAIKEACDAYGG